MPRRGRGRRLVAGGFALAVAAAAFVGCTSDDDSDAPATTSPTTGGVATAGASSSEPPTNPGLADSVWPAAHRDSYAQGTSDQPGPTAADEIVTERWVLPGVPIITTFSAPYPDGTTVAWTSLSNVPDLRAIAKLDATTGEPIDVYVPAQEGLAPPPNVALLSGVYHLVDADGRLVVAYSSRFEAYGDSVEGDPRSDIALVGTYQLPDAALCRPSDALVGQVLTYDGHLAFVTEMGMIGLLPQDVTAMSDDSLRTISLNGDACADPAVPDDELEQVANSIAADEDNGIYVVSDERMYRADLDGDAFELTWSAAYETGAALSVVRLGGGGSGSTPSLMGTGDDEDQLVVITDGAEVMNLTVFWRDEVPDGWEPIAPGKDPRIACEVPVRFGDPDAANTESEQSVAVRGWSSYLVNNRLENVDEIAELPEVTQTGSAALAGGDPALAPAGFERIDWDPETNTCDTVWANPDVRIPNGVPTMSEATGLVYGIGLHDTTWGLIGLDADTGEEALWVPGPGDVDDCADQQLAQFPAATSELFRPYFDRLPTSCDNSVYAATEVGPDGSVWTGLFGALGVYRPSGG